MVASCKIRSVLQQSYDYLSLVLQYYSKNETAVLFYHEPFLLHADEN